MAYKTKFLHFKTKASYEAERAKTTAGTEERKVFDAYISFIDEGPMICTWGKEYKCDISASEVEALVNAGKISPATVAPLIAGTAAVGTSTKYAREDHRHPEQVNITGNAATATTATNLASAPSFINNGNTIKITVGNKTSTEFTIPYASKTSSAETLMYGRNIFLDGDVTGSTTESFNGSKNVTINTTISTINAEKLTGIINVDRLPEIPIEKIPAAAMERLYVVESQSAAMSLTIQEGDVVQIGSGGPMYFCVSESASTFPTKFKVFTAGAATSVPWSGVTNAPTKLSQFNNDAGYLTSVPAQTWESITGKPTFATVATSGSYNDLTNKPTIPSAYTLPTASSTVLGGVKIGSGINISSGAISATYLSVGAAAASHTHTASQVTGLATVATSGSYNDLTNKPSIPSLSGYATQSWVTSQGYLTSIPAATSSAYGGIQIGYTTSGKNYAVQLSNGKAYVNVPWTDTNTNYYPTTFTWANGTTAGPTGSLTGSGMSTVSFGAIPSASATQSGVVTTGDQSFAGEKIFRGGISAQDADISDLIIGSSLEFNAFGRFNYIATSTEAGGIKIGATASGVNLPLVLNSSNQAYIAVTKGAVTAALGFTPANVNDIPEIPIALPNPYALTINGTSYTGSSAVSISTSKPLRVRMLTSSTVDAGYSYSCGTSKAISTLNGFSSTNPDSVIISSVKLTFTASNVIKMDGLDDLSGTWYIYCLSYMANSKIAVNGAVYA